MKHLVIGLGLLSSAFFAHSGIVMQSSNPDNAPGVHAYVGEGYGWRTPLSQQTGDSPASQTVFSVNDDIRFATRVSFPELAWATDDAVNNGNGYDWSSWGSDFWLINDLRWVVELYDANSNVAASWSNWISWDQIELDQANNANITGYDFWVNTSYFKDTLGTFAAGDWTVASFFEGDWDNRTEVNFTTVPEPTTALLLLTALGVVARRRKLKLK